MSIPSSPSQSPPIQTVKSDESTEIEVDIEAVQSLRSSSQSTSTKQYDSFASFCWHKAFCRCLLPLFVVGAVVIGVMMALGIRPNKDDIPFASFIFSRDGWEGLEAQELPRWNTRGSGVLQLEMLNALEDHWQPYFDQSIEEWNNGDPDVVELTVTKVTPNSDCDFSRGKFAVCAGDYGDTTFHGVNEVLVYGDTITASVAKLNEYYLSSSTEARKQYTMCHEIGHGFGLPHSDENFFNLNLGNCMDYTDRPWTNTAPDRSTYQLLQEIYGAATPDANGLMGEGKVIAAASSSSTSSTSTNGGNFWTDSKMEEISRDDSKDSDDEPPEVIPQVIYQRATEATRNLETKFADKDSDEPWVQLHRDEQSASFQIELGEGFFLQAHFLLAPKD